MISLTSEPFAPDGAVVHISGSIDPLTYEELSKQIDTLIATGMKRLVLDLSAVEWVSSVGAGVLLTYWDTIKSLGGSIILAAPRPEVMKILTNLGITENMDVVESTQTALAMINNN